MSDPTQEPAESPDDTGLPLARTWPIVYTFVLAWFLFLVVILTLLTRAYA